MNVSFESATGFRERVWTAIEPLVAVLVGIALGLLAVKAIGDSPWLVLQTLYKSAFGTWEDFGTTLFYSTPLIFTGLSVMVAMHAGLFNVGAEGQLLMGAMSVTVLGILAPNLPPLAAIPLGVLACAAGGAVYGMIPGVLRAKRDAHEVINTIMLNFIAAGITSYLALYPFKNTENQVPETSGIGAGYALPHFSIFGNTPLNPAFLLALFCVVLCSFFLWRTRLGFELRMTGENVQAARQYGIRVERVQILAMTIAGALAGLVGVNEILGSAGRFKLGFSPDYGFTGVAVALLGRNRPLGVLLAAFLFGALHKGTTDLDVETEKVTRDFSQVLQALIILAVGVSVFVSTDLKEKWARRFRRSGKGGERG